MTTLARAAGALGLFGAALLPSLLLGRAGPRDDPDHGWSDDTVFTVTQVRPGVYFAVGRQGRIVGSNSTFIVTDRDVILVDDHITPRAARALTAEIARVTARPLRYVINTHFHYDHVNGNSIFGPEVEILSSAFTRARLLEDGQAAIRREREAALGRLAALRTRRDTARSDSLRRALTAQLEAVEEYAADYATLTVGLPSLSIDSAVTLHRGGGQEIRVVFLGRGHTGGDVIVQLPREGLLITGDLMTNTAGLPFMADGYPGEWSTTLRRVAALDFATTLPGHGPPFEGKARYALLADVMDEVWRQARALAPQVPAGEPPERSAARFDVRRFAGDFPALRNGLPAVGARRALDLAAGRDR
jgi:glyoxylase-like metal-dependent hydrolase (beta-lactamase superfamily II)